MKQKFKVLFLIVVLTVILVVISPILSKTSEAGSSWDNEVLTEANSDIGKAGYNKKEELVKKPLDDSIKESFNPLIEEEKADLERMLEEYYNLRLQGLTDTEEYRVLEEKIKQLKQGIFDRYKAEIDSIFE